MVNRSTITPGDGDPRHGTGNGYTNLRCRCADCTEAWRVMRKAWVNRTEALAPGDQRHGTLNGYSNYRCRCDRCRAASRAASGAQERTPPQCGTVSAYTNLRCRCDRCRAANAAYKRSRRAAVKA